MKKRSAYTKKDFSFVSWTPAEIKAVAARVLEEKENAYQRIKGLSHPERTFENTVYAIEVTHALLWPLHAISLLMEVSPKKEVRAAAKQALQTAEKKLIELEYDEALYRAVVHCQKKKERRTPEEKKLLEDMLRGYRRMGFALSLKKRVILKKNLKELSRLSMLFSKTITDHQDQILVSEEELAGLPEHYIAGLTQAGQGKYAVTLQYPDLNPFMENADDPIRREELARKYLRKGGEKNLRTAEAILALRHANARLLGYADHGAYRLEEKMAKRNKTVFRFLTDLMDRVEGGVKKEMGELSRLKSEHTGKSYAPVKSFDVAYYSNKLKKEKFRFNSESLRPYFPLEKVKSGMFGIYEKLLGVVFARVLGIPLWHPDAELYSVSDEKSGALLAYFAMDLHPRENKYGHAAVFDVISGHDRGYGDSAYVAPFAALVTNFPKPRPDHPSLLSHDEVETFFHEFGHVVHETLTEARFVSHSGLSVARDFVEAPSQMFEHWVWDRKMLGKMSGHFETGKPLPKALLDNLLRAKNHMIASWVMRQLIFALYDMELHTGTLKKKNFIVKRYAELYERYAGFAPPKDALFLAGFGHFTGYDAGYYGYMWSKVYATDMFTRFEKEGLLNRRTGSDYRKWILEKGSSRTEMDLVKGFLGRKPTKKAFLKEMGLL